MSILLAQTFVVPLQFQDTMVVPEPFGVPILKINLRISNNLYRAHEELTDA